MIDTSSIYLLSCGHQPRVFRQFTLLSLSRHAPALLVAMLQGVDWYVIYFRSAWTCCWHYLFPLCSPTYSIYEQETVCSGVKRKLTQMCPAAVIPTVHFCVRCKGTKKQREEEECRFKGEFQIYFQMAMNWLFPKGSVVMCFMAHR